MPVILQHLEGLNQKILALPLILMLHAGTGKPQYIFILCSINQESVKLIFPTTMNKDSSCAYRMSQKKCMEFIYYRYFNNGNT